MNDGSSPVTSDASFRHSRANMRRGVLAATGMVLLVLAYLAYAKIESTRTEHLEAAERLSVSLSHILQEHARQSIEAVDLLIQTSTAYIGELSADGPPPAARVAAHMERQGARLSQVRTIGFIDLRGDVVALSRPVAPTDTADDSRVSVADRPYFRAHSTNPDLEFYISHLPLSRVSGKPLLGISRRVSTPEGGFVGVVFAAVEIDYFSRFYATLDIGPNGQMALLDGEGRAITARVAHRHRETVDDWSAAADPPDWVASRSDVPDLPFTVVVRLSKADVRAEAWRALDSHLLAFAGAAAMVVLLAGVLLHRGRRARRIEHDLARSEARFRDYIDLATHTVWEIDTDFCFTYVSASIAQIAGIDAETYKGKPRGGVNGALKDPEAFARHMEDLRAHKPFSEFVYGIENPKGGWRYLTSSGKPVFDSRGRFTGYRGVARNVTARIEREEALRKREREVRILFNQAPVGMAHTDIAGRWVAVNPALANLLDYSVDEALEIGAAACIHPDDRDFWFEMLDALKNDNEPRIALDKRYIRKNGSPVWVEVTVTRVKGGRDEEDFFICAVKSIDDRKRAEAALAERTGQLTLRDKAINSASQAIVIAGRLADNATIEYANPAFFRLTGQSEDDLVGQSLWSMRSAGGKRETLAAVRDALTNERDFQGEVTLSRGGEGTFWAEITISPVRDAHGEVTNFIGIFTDISERKSAEERLHQARKMEVVGQLTGGIAHDFNNLLTVIVGNTEILAEMLVDNEDMAEMATMAHQAARRGASLTERLLAFSRRQDLAPEAINVNKLVENMTALLRRTLGGAVETRINLGAAMKRIKADPSQLETALLNLALNARDAMGGAGSLSLTTSAGVLSAEQTAQLDGVEPGDYVTIAVTDTGCGMSPEVLSRVFEPFFTTKGVGKGSGLGLSMVFGYVAQTGGHITVDSREGKGTTVTLYLPLAADVDQSEGADDELFAAKEALAQGCERVLVVEDEPGVRKYVVAQLGMLGYDVLEAADGREALAVIYERDDIDILFTDIIMPGGLNGVELAKEVRALRPQIGVLLTSGYTDTALDEINLSEYGFKLLKKPYQRKNLAQLIREIADQVGEGALSPARGEKGAGPHVPASLIESTNP